MLYVEFFVRLCCKNYFYFAPACPSPNKDNLGFPLNHFGHLFKGVLHMTQPS
jgi:hypothetical protein